MKKLYTIRDVLIGYGAVNGAPAILDVPNDEVMERILRGSLAKGQQPNALNTNPEDKEIWCIGSFDEQTGVITPCQPRLVFKCIDYVEKGPTDHD